MLMASDDTPTRRDFIVLTASAVAGVGTVAATWPLIDSLNPSADVLAMATVEVDISSIEPGQAITVKWRGKPVFIRRRTEKEIIMARDVNLADLPDPQTDEERILKGHEEWLVVIGICTHLGCVPQGQRAGSARGEYGGWFCPCHGSHYDTAGRIRKGPAPKNLLIPEYSFLDNSVIRIG